MSPFASNVQFAYPELLFLLLLLPLVGWWYYRRTPRRYPTMQMSHVPTDVFSWRTGLRKALPVLRLLSMAALIIALARPQEAQREEQINAEGIDIVLAMDLSSSMLAQDFKPDRLQVSKQVAAEFVEKREYDRIGLVAFAGEAYTQVPLTIDHGILLEFLSKIEAGTLQDGTAIGMGLATAVNRLVDSEAKSKVVILLTDGVNNAGYIQPLTAAEIAEEYSVKVYTIGVGTTGDALTPVSRRSDGRYIFGLAKVEIDEALMRQLSEQTGGQYFRATSEESLQRIYAEIDQLEKTELEVNTIRRASEVFYPWVFLALLLVIVETLLRYTLLRTLP